MKRKKAQWLAGLILAAAVSVTSGYAQCWDSTTLLWSVTEAPTRPADNTLQIVSYSKITGDYYNLWYLKGDSAFYFNNTFEETSGWRQSTTTGGTYPFTTTITLQAYGTGNYYQSFVADAWTSYCGGTNGITFQQYCAIYGCVSQGGGFTSSNAVNISRHYVNWTGSQPLYLGGATTSGTYTSQSVIVSNGEGATSAPVYSISTNPGGAQGTLSCTNCVSPVYTATKGSACNTYDITIMANYGGFQGYLWIQNMWPQSLQTLWAEQNPQGLPLVPNMGWDTWNYNKVMATCNTPMNWVVVNEKFTSARDVYPGGTNWIFPQPFQNSTWVPAVWSAAGEFDAAGGFNDIMFQSPVITQNPLLLAKPVPVLNGQANYAEDPAHTVTTFGQDFYAVGTVSGQGMLIHTGTQTHYIDHGKAQ